MGRFRRLVAHTVLVAAPILAPACCLTPGWSAEPGDPGVSAVQAGATGQARAAEELFEQRVRPLLIDRCATCHGPDTAFASLRLDSRDGLLAGGDGGPVAFPGTARLGELARRLRDPDDTERMPPPEAGPRLSPDDIAAIDTWLAAGAPWPGAAPATGSGPAAPHWAFQPPPRVAVPPPETAPSPIDAWIDARLQDAGLTRSPTADRRSLIRRASYALVGLPPTIEEVEAFVADDRPDAWEQLVDRLLDSPRFGEHLGRMWLDLARYADTKGYVYDREERFFVHAPAYRDWVIDAFNRDLPFDRFVALQLAADRLVPAGDGDLAALGFLTTGRRFLGVTPDIIDDRIDVVTRGLLGLTVSCARCHDHKYDPIPTADYYALYGVFASSVDRLVPLPARDGQPTVAAGWTAELDRRREALAQGSARLRSAAMGRARERIADYLFAQRHLDRYPELGFDQIIAPTDLVPAVVRRWQAFLGRPGIDRDPVWAPLVALLPVVDADLAAEGPKVLAAISAAVPGLNPLVVAAFATPPHDGRDVADRYGRLFATIDARWKTALERAATAGLPPPPALDDPAAEALRLALLVPDSPCIIPDEPIAAIETLLPSDAVNELWKLSNDVERWLLPAPQAPPHALASFDRPRPVDAPLLRRGNPALKGPPVPRRFLTVIAGPDAAPFADGSGRMEMAAAIVAPDNPLTARVWANRLWLHLTGAGLVDTPSDFGTRAAPPSHPELLDWLAEALVADGWSSKRLLRRILLSETFRQSAALPEGSAALAVDPANRLLWRMTPRRLTVEQFRDTWLALSGELRLTGGGRPADPFAASGPFRRTIHCLVDRQYLATPLRVFDMANPDLHMPTRPETTVPQQALFALNHPFVAARARAVAARVFCTDGPDEEALDGLWRLVLQRDPSPTERAAAGDFLEAARRGGWGPGELTPAEQLVQALLVSNEVMFVE
jgi:mono/diheme cytochrome c family protein